VFDPSLFYFYLIGKAGVICISLLYPTICIILLDNFGGYLRIEVLTGNC